MKNNLIVVLGILGALGIANAIDDLLFFTLNINSTKSIFFVSGILVYELFYKK